MDLMPNGFASITGNTHTKSWTLDVLEVSKKGGILAWTVYLLLTVSLFTMPGIITVYIMLGILKQINTIRGM